MPLINARKEHESTLADAAGLEPKVEALIRLIVDQHASADAVRSFVEAESDPQHRTVLRECARAIHVLRTPDPAPQPGDATSQPKERR